jgi:dTDP-glucose 4,6-dehydratase
MKLLVTGGAGFIGSNFIHYIFHQHADWDIYNLDSLTYAGNLENLQDIEGQPGYHFIKEDITHRREIADVLSRGFDLVINFAAESHVDRSITDASPFIETNIKGTQVLLEGVREYHIPRYIQVSTDEVYGSVESGCCCETSPLLPNSPYAASKTAADLLCRAAWKTFGLPVMVSRCCNNYGPFQFPEKFIPLVITNALENREIPVYGDGLNVREWVYVKDHCRALERIILRGQPGEIYNIGSGVEKTNLDMVRLLLGLLGKSESLIRYVSDRPGHDRRYALDSAKTRRALDWSPSLTFEEGLNETVRWYTGHEPWWRKIKSGEYAEYYNRNYTHR